MKNVAFFLTPKSEVAFLYNDLTIKESLQKMRFHGYTSIPVITRTCKYSGTISEGDFLWYMADNKFDSEKLDKITIKNIIHKEKNPPVKITADIEELLDKSMNQNFIPVIDDLGTFIGIVTRKDIMSHYCRNAENKNL